MKHIVLTALAGLASVAFVDPPQHASLTDDGPHSTVTVGIRTLRPSLTRDSFEASSSLSSTGATIKYDQVSGVARLITGKRLLNAPPLAAGATVDDYAARALAYVKIHADGLAVRAADLELDRQAALLAADVQFIKFRVKRHGLLVQDAALDCRFRAGTLVQVANRTFAEATDDDRPRTAGLDRQAKGAVFASAATATRDVYRVIRDSSGYHLVRVAEFKVTGQDGRPFLVQLEGATGHPFEIRPTQFYLDGLAEGQVYPRYYKDEPSLLPYPELDLSYTGGQVTTDAAGHFADVPASAKPQLNGFAGTRVKVVPQTGSKVTATGRSDHGAWDVVFTSTADTANDAAADKMMAQSMTYYHLNKEIAHAKQFIQNDWLDSQVLVNVNLGENCNAYWDGASINLFSAGKGCANTGVIADVPYHEWGHGLHANTSGISDWALSEGFGDTTALLMTHSPLLGVGFKIVDGAPVRDLTTLKVYPDDANQVDPHLEGLIVAGSFWDLFQSLQGTYGEDKAGDLLSNYALKVISTVNSYTDVYDALLVIDGGGQDPSPNFCAINGAFARHGLAQADSSCK